MMMATDRWYLKGESLMPFPEARPYCESKGLKLASIRTPQLHHQAAGFAEMTNAIVWSHVQVSWHWPLSNCTNATECFGKLKDSDNNIIQAVDARYNVNIDATVGPCVQMRKNGDLETRDCTSNRHPVCESTCGFSGSTSKFN